MSPVGISGICHAIPCKSHWNYPIGRATKTRFVWIYQQYVMFYHGLSSSSLYFPIKKWTELGIFHPPSVDAPPVAYLSPFQSWKNCLEPGPASHWRIFSLLGRGLELNGDFNGKIWEDHLYMGFKRRISTHWDYIAGKIIKIYKWIWTGEIPAITKG